MTPHDTTLPAAADYAGARIHRFAGSPMPTPTQPQSDDASALPDAIKGNEDFA
jgi:hypothetical protein